MDQQLARLAAVHGVATSYDDWSGKTVDVAEPAVVAALAALGVQAGDDQAIRVALADAEAAPWRRMLAPVTVTRGAGTVEVRARSGIPIRLSIVLEDGSTVEVPPKGPELEVRGGRARRRIQLPELPLGYHRLTARSGDERDEAALIVAPRSLTQTPGRAWGWMVQLYSLRSEQSWAVGDYEDLRTVVRRSAEDGAGALLLNPVHAETPVLPLNPSPYSPSSRLFRSPLWLRIERTEEYAAADPEVRAKVDALKPVTDPERVRRDPAWEAKRAALELLWPTARPVEEYRRERGQTLEEFALFCALAEEHGVPWQAWPEELRRPDGAGIAAARTRHQDRIAFWCWVQQLVDEQLEAVTTAAGDMLVGVIHDLAVGVDAGGADAWALQDALALTTTVGAPPDSFNQQGQDWGLPPWRPDRLRDLGYAPYRSLVQGVLRHAGGLRIDHVMGLFRLWWVPAGAGAAEGTYVSYDADALIGVLALEAVRAGALVVGEDLGTVEETVRTSLAEAGILGSAVLWFERDEGTGAFLDPATWREAVLATVTTHDLPTATGFLAGEHVRVRAELGQLGVPLEQEQGKALDDQVRLIEMLRAAGLLETGPLSTDDVVLAMHAALVASPATLVLAALGDAVGDLRQPNLPGTVDQYPNWRLPVADGSGRPLALEQLLDHPGVRRLVALLAGGVGAVRYGPATHHASHHASGTDLTRTP